MALSVRGRMMTSVTENSALLSPTAHVEAVTTAVAASAMYYGYGTTPLGDDAYDGLLRAIAAHEEAHPDEVLAESPTGKVAGGAVQGDVPHSVPMLSLDNVFDADELAERAAAAAADAVLSTPVADLVGAFGDGGLDPRCLSAARMTPCRPAAGQVGVGACPSQTGERNGVQDCVEHRGVVDV